MMFCSRSLTSPASVPSRITDLTSSSVTRFDSLLSPKRLTSTDVERDSNHTAGSVSTDRKCMGRATAMATRSDALRPIRLGNSSPTTMDRYVTMMTMTVCATTRAVAAESPAEASQAANSLDRAAPEKRPVRMPMRVMPIWTVDRKRSGSSDSFNAVAALRLPFFAAVESRDLRADIRATSDIENIPLRRIRIIIIIRSLM